ncbi:MAG: hypothetical protein Q4D79_06650, partial [Propionibacteriaceae bacterium]|nr:hypothetical protein [Propionibacteriaceae bacterium]
AGAWQRAAGGVAMPVCYAVLSACGAAVFRGTGPGIVTALAVLGLGGLVALIGGGASAAITPVLPVAAIHSLAGNAAGPEAIGVLGGMLSLALWLVAASLLARWRLVRHDA